jgi:hypothetical protein
VNPRPTWQYSKTLSQTNKQTNKQKRNKALRAYKLLIGFLNEIFFNLLKSRPITNNDLFDNLSNKVDR